MEERPRAVATDGEYKEAWENLGRCKKYVNYLDCVDCIDEVTIMCICACQNFPNCTL